MIDNSVIAVAFISAGLASLLAFTLKLMSPAVESLARVRERAVRFAIFSFTIFLLSNLIIKITKYFLGQEEFKSLIDSVLVAWVFAPFLPLMFGLFTIVALCFLAVIILAQRLSASLLIAIGVPLLILGSYAAAATSISSVTSRRPAQVRR